MMKLSPLFDWLVEDIDEEDDVTGESQDVVESRHKYLHT